MKRYYLLIVLLVAGCFPLFAQSEVNNMLKDINGKVDEIVIKSEGKTFTFSGDEAEKLFLSMKDNKLSGNVTLISKDGKIISGDSINKKIIIKELNNDNDKKEITVVVGGNADEQLSDIKEIEKRVVVTEDNGNKIVTVTTNEDGKENIEIFKGKAADEFLEQMNSETKCKAKNEDDGCCSKKHKKIIIEKNN